MKKIVGFVKHYFEFSIVLIVFLIGLGLFFADLQTAAHAVIGTVAVLATLPILKGIWDDVRAGTYGVDILAVTAILVAVAMQEYWAAIIVVLMLTGGEALEDYAEHRAKRELDALLDHAPQKARVIKKHGRTIEVPVQTVGVKDKLEVRPGEVVPVDGILLEGEASFDESSLTGESLPQLKKKGDQVLSGSIATDGLVVMQATATAEHSQYQEIIKLVQSASTSQSPFVRLADRYSIPFTIIAFGIAFGAWAISGDSLRFLQVLVVATPCPLILAAPIAIISGMSRAAKQGIIIRTGSALEAMAAAKTIAFDKTGTLTEGRLEVTDIETYNGYTKSDVLQLAASLEANSNHVLADAVVHAAHAKKLKLIKIKSLKETAGHGLLATVSGKHVIVGRQSFLESHNITVRTTRKHTTATYVAIDGTHAGTLLFADTIRTEAKSTLERLAALGVHDIHMVTGDTKQAAQAVAKQLAIDHVTAEALPRDKLHTIEKLENRPVAFVGDGVNDAPVLAASNVGIALGAKGATAASESADIVIMLDDLRRVATAREVSRHTIKIAKQSILVGIGLSVILMLIFATGKYPPVYGALLQEVVDIVVIINALRAHGTFKRTYAA